MIFIYQIFNSIIKFIITINIITIHFTIIIKAHIFDLILLQLLSVFHIFIIQTIVFIISLSTNFHFFF